MAGEAKRNIFVGSTEKDLRPHRQRIRAIIEDFGYFKPLMMKEDFGPGETDAITQSLDYVDQADIYIGIFAHRYGYIQQPDSRNPNGLSISELEYNRAKERNLIKLCFVLPDEEAWFSGEVYVEADAEKVKKLEAFKARLKNDLITSPFTAKPESLDSTLKAALEKIKEIVSLPYAVLAMTKDELTGFWDTSQHWLEDVNAEFKDAERIDDLKNKIKAENIDEQRLFECYGSSRTDWKPSGDLFSMGGQLSTGISIGHILDGASHHFNAMILGKNATAIRLFGLPKLVELSDLSEKLCPTTPESEWSADDKDKRIAAIKALSSGGIIIADIMSLMHPKLRRTLRDSSLDNVPNVSIVCTLPIAMTYQSVNKYLDERLRATLAAQVPSRYEEELDLLCELNVARPVQLKRWFYMVMPQLVNIRSNRVANRDNLPRIDQYVREHGLQINRTGRIAVGALT